MKVQVDFDDVLNSVFEQTSDEDLHTLFELLCRWQEKVGDEIDYVKSLNDYADDDE